MRDYTVMRNVLSVAASTQRELFYSDFSGAGMDDELMGELLRLTRDGLLDADVSFGGGFGEHSRCRVSGLTDEGRAFFNLIENGEVWGIISGTLAKAGVDISYPLLKEVCEEIVKRYVLSFIPDVPKRR